MAEHFHYAQRAFPNTSSMLTVGDAHTSGELFDSIGFRGINLATDDRGACCQTRYVAMRPSSVVSRKVTRAWRYARTAS